MIGTSTIQTRSVLTCAGWSIAEKVVHYVAPVGHKQEYVERAAEVVAPYLERQRVLA